MDNGLKQAVIIGLLQAVATYYILKWVSKTKTETETPEIES
jgi:hypothetical protein